MSTEDSNIHKATYGEANLEARMLVGGEWRTGRGKPFTATDPSTRRPLAPTFIAGDETDIDDALNRAQTAYASYRRTSPAERADFLDSIAAEIDRDRDALVARSLQETGLPQARLEGEVGRASGQLRFFAAALRDGWPFDARIDEPTPAQNTGKPDLRLVNAPVGPVVVFGASNFPFAFSNAGGDTASALAAGCPVVVKVHEAHPGTATLISQAIHRAIRSSGMPEGIYSALFSPDHAFSAALVAHPLTRAVGFTGSRSGGIALAKIAATRPRPIPMFAEMSSVNPVVLLGKAANPDTAAEFVASLTLGSGQYCTNPGLLFVLNDESGNSFVQTAADLIGKSSGTTMLTHGIYNTFAETTSRLSSRQDVELLAKGREADASNAPAPHLFMTNADVFTHDPSLQTEIFGASALIVRCNNFQELISCLETLEGQLTATIHALPEDFDSAAQLLPILEDAAGRVIFNDWPTGVAVSDAMVHGGPYPATTDVRTTSVGALAIMRFLRPVSWQNVPQQLLPPALQNSNPWSLPRRVNAKHE